MAHTNRAPVQTRARLLGAAAILLAYGGLCAVRWVCDADPAFEFLHRLLTFVLVGLALPLVWIWRSGSPAEQPASVYRLLLLTAAALAAAVLIFPELRRPDARPDLWSAAAHLTAAVGLGYLAFRLLPLLLPERPFAVRLVWGCLIIAAAVPTARGLLVGGLGALLTLAAGSWLPALILLAPLAALELGPTHNLATTGGLLAAILVGTLLLLLFTRRFLLPTVLGRQHPAQNDETDPLGDIGDQEGQHQGVGGVEVAPDEGRQDEAQREQPQ
jgi:hypothetical protein